jgi:hypothetical protein
MLALNIGTLLSRLEITSLQDGALVTMTSLMQQSMDLQVAVLLEVAGAIRFTKTNQSQSVL